MRLLIFSIYLTVFDMEGRPGMHRIQHLSAVLETVKPIKKPAHMMNILITIYLLLLKDKFQ